MTPPSSGSSGVPPYRLDLGAGYSSIALGNGAPSYHGGHYQVRLGHDFRVHPRHNFFLNGVFRNHFLSSDSDETKLNVTHFGLEGGYEAWLVPDQFSFFILAGLGTNIFYSPDIRTEEDGYSLPLENGAALALTGGAGFSIGRGIFSTMAGIQPSFGLSAVPDEEYPWREGFNPLGWYLTLALDLARITAAAGGEFPDPDASAFAQGIRVGTILDGSYTYNFNRPGNGENQLRIYDNRNDRPMFNLAQFSLVREADETSPFGIGLVFDAGENPAVSGAADSFNGGYHDLQQFWGELRLPIGQRGVTLRGGKVATIIGPEAIERAYNNQATMSWGNGLFLPFTHWGAIAKAPLTDGFVLALGVVNGWDNVYGRSTGPAGLLGFSGEPVDWFSWSLTGAMGADQGRFLGTGNGIATFTGGDFSFTTSLILTGQGENGPEAPSGTTFAAFINPRYQFHHHVALSGRAEVAHDPEGIRTGTPQTLGGFALALPIRPVPESHYRYFPLEIRPEIRHDLSSTAPFLAGDAENPVSGQTTFGISATLNWENWLEISRSSPE